MTPFKAGVSPPRSQRLTRGVDGLDSRAPARAAWRAKGPVMGERVERPSARRPSQGAAAAARFSRWSRTCPGLLAAPGGPPESRARPRPAASSLRPRACRPASRTTPRGRPSSVRHGRSRWAGEHGGGGPSSASRRTRRQHRGWRKALRAGAAAPGRPGARAVEIGATVTGRPSLSPWATRKAVAPVTTWRTPGLRRPPGAGGVRAPSPGSSSAARRDWRRAILEAAEYDAQPRARPSGVAHPYQVAGPRRPRRPRHRGRPRDGDRGSGEPRAQSRAPRGDRPDHSSSSARRSAVLQGNGVDRSESTSSPPRSGLRPPLELLRPLSRPRPGARRRHGSCTRQSPPPSSSWQRTRWRAQGCTWRRLG